MPKVRGGKLIPITRTIPIPNPRKSKNATINLFKKLDQVSVVQEKEMKETKYMFDKDNDSDHDYYQDVENDEDENVDNDDQDYEDDNVDRDDHGYEDDKNYENDNVDEDYSDDNDDVSTVHNNETNEKVLVSKSRHVRTHNVNQQSMSTVPTWAIQLREEIKNLRNDFKEFINSINEWKTMIQPLLDVNLLTSADVPKVIPFLYVDDLENFERATEAEKMELVRFFKGFCTNNVQASCNEILINSIGSDEYITPFVTTEGKGSLHPASLPPMIKTKFGECVKSALSLRSNKFPKPSSSDFKNIFDEALKVIKNRRRRLEKAGKLLAINKADKTIQPKKRPAV